MHRCSKCGVEATPTGDNFSANKRRKSGLCGWCRKCLAEATKKWNAAHRDRRLLHYKKYRETHKEKCRAQFKAYYATHKEHKRATTLEWRKRNPELVRAMRRRAVARYRRRYPEKAHAHDTLCRAIQRGVIVKQPCVVCGSIKAEGHHSDYTKPLDVIWLCRKHHRDIHKTGDKTWTANDRREHISLAPTAATT